MNEEFFAALEALEERTGIKTEYMLEKVEAAMLAAYKRDNAGNSNVKVFLDSEKKEMRLFRLKDVVETVEDETIQINIDDAKKINSRYELGDVAEIEFTAKDFGRISAQNAKQVIIQAVREAEREMLVREYEDKKDGVLSAVVYRIDPNTGNVILNIGKGEAALAKNEQLPRDKFVEGGHVKVFVMEVKNQARGPLISLSRRHPGLVRRLFELEVPEIGDGTAEIKSIAREAGARTKIAVHSDNPDVDPVGACIGARGSRINNVVNELCGEKIDVIKYSDDPAEYISAALSPATVLDITLEGERSCRAVVADSQLSLAIGREGQNARLAARLTGYKIDIKTPSALLSSY